MKVSLPTHHQLKEQIGEAYAAWYWSRRHKSQTQADRVWMILSYRALRNALARGEYTNEVNERGNTIYRSEDADNKIKLRAGQARYVYDGTLCAQGWQQYDTYQDAWYFGVWVNLELRQIFTYAEGDRSLIECPNEQTLCAELTYMSAFYGEPPSSFRVYDLDNGSATAFYEERPTV